MYTIKKLFKTHSPYLLLLTLIEGFVSIIVTLSFVYTDSLNYTASKILSGIGVDELLKTMYSSTWWALILLLLAFIVIFNLVTIIYHKMEFMFMSICCWFIMFILAINIGNPVYNILSVFALFVPIIIINIIAYRTEKNKLEELEEKKNTKKKQKNKAAK